MKKKISNLFFKMNQRKVFSWCKVDLSIFIKKVPNSFTFSEVDLKIRIMGFLKGIDSLSHTLIF